MQILFSETPWFIVDRSVRRGVKSEINASDENWFHERSMDDLCKYFVDKYWTDVPVLNRNEIFKDRESKQIDGSQGIRIEITVPYTGEMKAFRWQPTRSTLNPPRAYVSHSGKHLLLVFIRTILEADSVDQEIYSTLDKIDDYLEALREDANKLNSDLESFARQCIEKR